MDIEEINDKYFNECVNIAIKQYSEEEQKVAALYSKDYKEEIKKVLKRLFSLNNGVVALENHKVVGYLLFGQIRDTYKTNIKGIASSLLGYGAIGDYRKKIISLLFQYASDNMRKKGVGHKIIAFLS